jgi:GNAT superfamily N-acetyltransferase
VRSSAQASDQQKVASLMLHVRPAEKDDMPIILGFIGEAAAWLADKGTDQWSRPWPDKRRRDARVRRGIRDKCTWMVEEGGRPIATISCRPRGNPKLWTDAESAEPAVYVSRLIVCRDYGGQAIGNELFDWAGKWAAAQYGARWIRIDVWTTNTMLHEYYEKRGFSFMRECDHVDYPSAMLFQKPTAGITDADLRRLKEIPALARPTSLRPSLVRSARHLRPAPQLAGGAALRIAARLLLLTHHGRGSRGRG